MKLIIVDDSPNIRQNLKKLIARIEGIEVAGEAEDEYTAIQLVTDLKPDVVILDIDLKDNGNGFVVLTKIKKINNTIVVIMFSNFSSKWFRDKAVKEKANYFFDKHTEIDKLISILEDLSEK